MTVRIATVITEGETILLARHRRRGLFYWSLPGGRLEDGETIEACLRRELMEVTGLDVEPRNLLFIADVFPYHSVMGAHVVNLIFRAEVTGGSLRPGHGGNLDETHDEIAFVPIASLPEHDLYPPLGEHIADALKEGFRGETKYLGNLWQETEPTGRGRAAA
jgi:ADP-ribose pyrophosphatase YjhB (NUDIX family)